jgi:hypothetical protein
MHKVETNTFLYEVSTDVSDSATGIKFYGHQGIDMDKVMERNNLLIRHKYGKKIFMIER